MNFNLNRKIEYFFVLLFLLFVFLPRILFLPNQELNIDESLWLVGIKKLTADPVFWRSFDGTTSGPLVTLPFALISKFFKINGYSQLRLAGILIYLIPAFLLLYMSFRKYLSSFFSFLSIFPVLLRDVLTGNEDFFAYNGEWACIFFISAVIYISVSYLEKAKSWKIFLAGFVLAIMPFAKIQIIPVAGLLSLYFILLVYKNKKYIAAFLFGACTFFLILLIYLLSTGLTNDFFNSYILTSLNYSGQGGISDNHQSFFHKAGQFFWLLKRSAFYYSSFSLLIIYLCSKLNRPVFLFKSFHFLFVHSLLNRLALLFVLLLSSTLLSIFFPGTAFWHYTQLLIPVFALLTSLFLYFLFKNKTFTANDFFFVGLILIVPAFFYFKSFKKRIDQYPKNGIPLINKPVFAKTESEKILYQQIDSVNKIYVTKNIISIWGLYPKLYLYLNAEDGTRDGLTYFQSSSHNQLYFQNRYLNDLNKSNTQAIIELKIKDYRMKRINQLPFLYQTILNKYEKVFSNEYFDYYKRK